MNFKTISFKTVFAICSIFACTTLFTACGDDSSSGNGEVEENEGSCSSNDKSSDSNDKSSSSIEEKEIHEGAITEALEIDISKYAQGSVGKVVDSRNKQEYNTLRNGISTWILENVNIKLTEIKSTCYAYDDSKCSKYGRLYMKSGAAEACPEGFTLPTTSEWRNLANLHEDIKLTYAGTCSKRDTLECSGLDSTVAYLTSNDSAVVFQKDGTLKTVAATKNGFYSLRCVKSQSIVDSPKDLPRCNEDSNYPYIYVVSQDSSYRCSYDEWITVSSSYQRECRSFEEDSKYVYRDSLLFTCKNGKWTTAGMEDVDKCTLKKIDQEYSINGQRYVCSDTGWVTLKYPASQLGLCTEKNYGKTAKTDKGDNFACDSTGWKNATVYDVYGACESAIFNKVVIYDSVTYVCRQNHIWDYATTIELKLGYCFDEEIEDGIYGDDYYTCKNGSWVKDDNWSHLPPCDYDHLNDTVSIGSNLYYCNDFYIWQTAPNFQFRDSSVHICNKKMVNKVITVDDDSYVCEVNSSKKVYDWRYATATEVILGGCPSDTTYDLVTDSLTYECFYGTWSSSKTTITSYVGSCTRYTATVIDTVFNGTRYVCDSSTHKNNWFTPTSFELEHGYCRTAILDSVVISADSSTLKKCLAGSTTSAERKWTDIDWYDNLGTCTSTKLDETAFNGVNESICKAQGTKYTWMANLTETVTDERTGFSYSVVKIGDKTWMAEDLIYVESDPEDPAEKSSHLTYNWHTAMNLEADADSAKSFTDSTVLSKQYQGLCMEGWHLPTSAEWNKMFTLLSKKSGYSTVAYNVAKIYNSNWTSSPGKVDFGVNIDAFGYDSTYYDEDLEAFKTINRYAGSAMYYWLPRETGAMTGSYIEINSSRTSISSTARKTNAYNIRCVKND